MHDLAPQLRHTGNVLAPGPAAIHTRRQVLMVSLCVQACRSSTQRRYDKECERGIYFELYYVASGWRSIRFNDPVEEAEELLQNLQVPFKGQRAAKELNEGISCHPLTSLTVFITT